MIFMSPSPRVTQEGVDAHLHDCVEVDDTKYIWFIWSWDHSSGGLYLCRTVCNSEWVSTLGSGDHHCWCAALCVTASA